MTKGMSMNMKLPHRHGHQHGKIRVLRASSHISSLDPKQRRALGHKNFLLSAAQYNDIHTTATTLSEADVD